MNNKILALAGAHVTQLSGNKGKTDWIVKENITGDVIGNIPGNVTEEEVFEILRFARKFELVAYNEGIALGKAKTVKVYDQHIAELKAQLEARVHENNRLSEALENITRHSNN